MRHYVVHLMDGGVEIIDAPGHRVYEGTLELSTDDGRGLIVFSPEKWTKYTAYWQED